MNADMEMFSTLTSIAEQLKRSVEEKRIPGSAKHNLPDRDKVVATIYQLREILFPGYFGNLRDNGSDMTCFVEKLGTLFWNMTRLIHDTEAHTCSLPCESGCNELSKSARQALGFLKKLPPVREALFLDVAAAFEGDPAAQDFEEVIMAYPGLFAVMVYRLAHELHLQGVRLIPRILTEYAHSVTGIDIHPAARIGKSFFIDHGTGVVIGETCVIGNNVKIYQGVTLGALSIPKDENGRVIRVGKRHPTIEDDVIIYAGATILGGDTVIGRGSIIGGNVWLIESVPPGSKVINRPTVEMRKGPRSEE